MKIILSFDDTDPYEREKAELAVKSASFFLAVLDYSNWLGDVRRQPGHSCLVPAGDALRKLNSCLGDHGCSLEMLS